MVCEVISIKKLKFYQLCLALMVGILLNSMTIFIKLDPVMAQNVNDMTLSKTNFDMTPFFWALAIVGGCIAVTLGYVSWRKYKAEQKAKIEQDTSVD